jgi:hypothetical protein
MDGRENEDEIANSSFFAFLSHEQGGEFRYNFS